MRLFLQLQDIDVFTESAANVLLQTLHFAAAPVPIITLLLAEQPQDPISLSQTRLVETQVHALTVDLAFAKMLELQTTHT